MQPNSCYVTSKLARRLLTHSTASRDAHDDIHVLPRLTYLTHTRDSEQHSCGEPTHDVPPSVFYTCHMMPKARTPFSREHFTSKFSDSPIVLLLVEKDTWILFYWRNTKEEIWTRVMRYAMTAYISRKFYKRPIKWPLHYTTPYKRTLPPQGQIRPQAPTNMRVYVVGEAAHPLSSPSLIHVIKGDSSQVVDTQVTAAGRPRRTRQGQ